MSVESTTQTMNSYLETLSQRGDFGQHFTEDVLWTTMETGQEIRGREAVRDSILAMHAQIFDAHPQLRSITIGDGTAALEADFIGVHTGEFAGIPATGVNVRVPYSVFYDVTDEGISALRAYLPLGQMVAQLEGARSSGS